MKKAVIATGGKQYIVEEGTTLSIELVESDKNSLEFVPLLVVDGANTKIGSPELSGAKVSAQLDGQVKTDKVTSIRFKAKKRVHKRHGHRQLKTNITIKKITS